MQLVNAADGCQVWSERYDREMRDVFELQDEITLAVVAALKLKLFGEERAAVLKRYTDNAEVYELFLKGRHHAYKYTAQGWQRAIELFEKAIARFNRTTRWPVPASRRHAVASGSSASCRPSR